MRWLRWPLLYPAGALALVVMFLAFLPLYLLVVVVAWFRETVREDNRG